VFRDWKPDRHSWDALRQTVASLIPNTGDAEIPLVHGFLQVDPLLMAWGVRASLQGRPPAQSSGALKSFRHAVVQGEDSRPRAAEVAEVMGVDEGFVTNLTEEVVRAFRRGQSLRGHDANNLTVAVAALEPFRRLLALRLLDEIEHALTRGRR
jgi:hypothetical protein